MDGEPLFRAESLEFTYDGDAVVDIPSLDIPSGGVSVLAGPNGSGKTTLLKLLNGLLVPTAGRIVFEGRTLDSESIGNLRRQSVLVHQNPYLFDGTVYSNVAYGLRLRRVPAERMREAVDLALGRVGLAGFEHRKAKRLSGGDRQGAGDRSPDSPSGRTDGECGH